MSHENKHNVHYFEASSMKDLYHLIERWQSDNNQRFLCINTQKDNENFCCIALTNPMEVVIGCGRGANQAFVGAQDEFSSGALWVRQIR